MGFFMIFSSFLSFFNFSRFYNEFSLFSNDFSIFYTFLELKVIFKFKKPILFAPSYVAY